MSEKTDNKIIKRDLEIHITKKLRQWFLDSAMLYEAVDLPAGENIILVMLKLTVRTLAKAMTKEKFLRAMSAAYDCAVIDNEEARQHKEKENAKNR